MGDALPGTLFNDFEPFNVEWLENLYPEATINATPIEQLTAADVAAFRRVHLFAGIGGWEEALALAGWPENAPIWTGSCPCQPYSAAGKRLGDNDLRNLWPHMLRLVRECRPGVVVGEQVPGAIGLGWLDRVSSDLEAEGYAVGSVVLGAHSVGAPQKRDRLYWSAVSMGAPSGKRRSRRSQQPARKKRKAVERASAPGGSETTTKQRGPGDWDAAWKAYSIIRCRDGKLRQISAQCGDEPVAYGIPQNARHIVARLCELGESATSARRIVREARTNRSGRLRGYGNAIVPQVAAVFVRALMETLAERSGSDERPTDGHRTAAEDRGGGVASEND